MNDTYSRLFDRLTLEEKIALVTGADFFASRPVEHLNIPAFKMSDGPHGLRAQAEGKADHLGLNASAAATCFPSGAAMASSWNPEIPAAAAKAMGQEAHYFNVKVVLGPAFNIKRSPLCGRDFEYYSEDPYLAGRLAASYVKAMQSEKVSVCLKHFAGNNQEDRRMISNSVIDERTLREIYLPAFETAVKEGKPWSVMCAYNKINGTFCSENSWLLNDVLRKEWGFDGAVISDWGAVSDRTKSVKGGLDLEMPGTAGFSDENLRRGLAAGEVTEEELDTCVKNLLLLMDRIADAAETDEIDLEGHHAIAQKAAEECLVLLKNEDAVLPLKKQGRIAVLGALAEQPRYQGGGSSHVSSWKVDCTLEELKARAGEAEICYAPGYSLEDGNIISEEYLAPARELAKSCEQVVVFIGITEQYETEGSDRKDMSLPAAHNALVDAVLAVNPNAAIVMTVGAPAELPWVDRAKALISTYTAGDGLGSAAAKIVFGEVNPSGKLAETMPVCLEHNPSYLTFRESKTDIRYTEGVFVGYRWYEKRKLPVLFPFGHGLSYTSFAYSNLKLSASEIDENDELTVTCDITNTGRADGREVVQLYVGDQVSSVPRPVKELKGFAKAELQPGETKTVSFRLNRRSFAFYDTAAGDWAVEPGTFTVQVGASSADIRLTAEVQVNAKPWGQLTQVSQETTFGELLADARTEDCMCRYLTKSPMFQPKPGQWQGAADFLLNLPLWTLNHMAGEPITPDTLRSYVEELNGCLRD